MYKPQPPTAGATQNYHLSCLKRHPACIHVHMFTYQCHFDEPVSPSQHPHSRQCQSKSRKLWRYSFSSFLSLEEKYNIYLPYINYSHCNISKSINSLFFFLIMLDLLGPFSTPQHLLTPPAPPQSCPQLTLKGLPASICLVNISYLLDPSSGDMKFKFWNLCLFKSSLIRLPWQTDSLQNARLIKRKVNQICSVVSSYADKHSVETHGGAHQSYRSIPVVKSKMGCKTYPITDIKVPENLI